ncbi:MAG: hypothetical protein ABEJ08_02405 [Halobacteriaceae archaeon]
MRRRALLGALAGAGTFAIAGCTGGGSGNDTTTTTPGDSTTTTPGDSTTTTPAPDPTSLVNPSFEDGLAGWTVGRDLPYDPGNQDQPVDSSVGTTDESASAGTRSLEMTIDGSADDGTVWVQQSVDLTDPTVLHVDYLTMAGGANVITEAAVYAGPDPGRPLTETDFDTEKALQRADGGDWQTFQYDIEHDGTGLVAVGMNVIWETEVRGLLDNVALAAP